MPIYKFSLCLFTLLFLSGCPFDDTSRTVTQEVVTPPVTDPNNPDTEKPPVTDPDIEKPPVTDPDIEKPPVTDPDIEKPPVTDPDIEKPPVTDPDIEKPPVVDPDKPDIETPPVTPPPPPPPPPQEPIFEQTGLYFNNEIDAFILTYGTQAKPQMSILRTRHTFLHIGDLVKNTTTPNTYDSNRASISAGVAGGLSDSFQIETEPTTLDFSSPNILALSSGVNQSRFTYDYIKVPNSFPLAQFEGNHVSDIDPDWAIKIEGSELTLNTGGCVVTGSVKANEYFYSITDATATGCADTNHNGSYQGQLFAYDKVNNPIQGKVQTLGVSFQNDTNMMWSSFVITTPPAKPAFAYTGLFYEQSTNTYLISYGTETVPQAAIYENRNSFTRIDDLTEKEGQEKSYDVNTVAISTGNGGGLSGSFSYDDIPLVINFAGYPNTAVLEEQDASGGVVSSSSLQGIKSTFPPEALAGTYTSATNDKWSIKITGREFVLNTENCIVSGSLQPGTDFYVISAAKVVSCANPLVDGNYDGQLFSYNDPTTASRIIAVNLIRDNSKYIWSFIHTN